MRFLRGSYHSMTSQVKRPYTCHAYAECSICQTVDQRPRFPLALAFSENRMPSEAPPPHTATVGVPDVRWAISRGGVPDGPVAFAAVDVPHHPVRRLADAAARPVEGRYAHVAGSLLPLAVWRRRAAHASVVDVLDLEHDQPRAQRDVLVREPVKDRLVDGDVGGEVFGDGVDLAGRWRGGSTCCPSHRTSSTLARGTSLLSVTGQAQTSYSRRRVLCLASLLVSIPRLRWMSSSTLT